MNTVSHSQTDNRKTMPWYKVPIMWLMLGLLGSTVISGVSMFILAHDTKDTLVVKDQLVPLSKKLALPENNIPLKSKSD